MHEIARDIDLAHGMKRSCFRNYNSCIAATCQQAGYILEITSASLLQPIPLIFAKLVISTVLQIISLQTPGLLYNIRGAAVGTSLDSTSEKESAWGYLCLTRMPQPFNPACKLLFRFSVRLVSYK